jgi:hypothetical protein
MDPPKLSCPLLVFVQSTSMNAINSPSSQLWAVLLRNSSDAFITQSTAVDFLEMIEGLIVSYTTSPDVRDAVLQALGDAVSRSPTRSLFFVNQLLTEHRYILFSGPELHGLWMRVKANDQPKRVSRRGKQSAYPEIHSGFTIQCARCSPSSIRRIFAAQYVEHPGQSKPTGADRSLFSAHGSRANVAL